MVVDSDDLISNRISKFVNAYPNHKPGWIVTKGYFYREGRRFSFYKKKDFNLLCGSCLILAPEFISDVIIPNPIKPNFPLEYYGHKTISIKGESFSNLPFAGAIYSMANGENIQATAKNVKGIASRIFTFEKIFRVLDILRKYRLRYLNRRIKKHFGLYSIKTN